MFSKVGWTAPTLPSASPTGANRDIFALVVQEQQAGFVASFVVLCDLYHKFFMSSARY
jgi:hypothetical protein